MKRSKWCKYCNFIVNSNKKICSLIIENEPCINTTEWEDAGDAEKNMSMYIQNYRDWLAKRIKDLKSLKSKFFSGSSSLVYSGAYYEAKKCASMLDPEKSAKVAARVQEIKEWREQK